MKDARYLIRIAPKNPQVPAQQGVLLETVRQLLRPLGGQAINLRVTTRALEFDLFCPSEESTDPFLNALKTLGPVITCKRLDLPKTLGDASAVVAEARQLFNEHRFWEVHEVLEDLWKARSGSEKQLVQGLILAAAALVHQQKNETAVVWPMLRDARRRLDPQPATYFGWNIADFRGHLDRWLEREAIDFPTV